MQKEQPDRSAPPPGEPQDLIAREPGTRHAAHLSQALFDELPLVEHRPNHGSASHFVEANLSAREEPQATTEPDGDRHPSIGADLHPQESRTRPLAPAPSSASLRLSAAADGGTATAAVWK